MVGFTAATVVFWSAIERLTVAARLLALDARAREAMCEPSFFAPRLTAAGGISASLARAWPRADRPAKRLELARALTHLGQERNGDSAARLRALANLLVGDCDGAVRNFEQIRFRRAVDWNDLAAARICAVLSDGSAAEWVAALVAADAALALDIDLTEARFNRSLILDSLGITPLSRAHWKNYLRADPVSQWSRIAHGRLRAIRPSDNTVWKTETEKLDQLSSGQLTDLANRYPQSARRYADVIYLSEWAQATADGRLSEAEVHLARVRIIAEALEDHGESLLADVVKTIEGASPESQQMRDMTAGQLAYQRGRQALQNGPLAEKELRTALQLLRDGNSPMADVVEFWIACVLTEQNRTDEALNVLERLIVRDSIADGRYRSLAGHAHYQLSLLEGFRGNWSASLAAAEMSRIEFVSIGERGNAANAEVMLAEDYDLLGQPELAWQHGLIALRNSVADGALDRTRVTLAALSRVELRRRDWVRARAIVTVERELAPLATDLRLEPDMFIRTAAAEWHLGNDNAAGQWMREARLAAERVADPALRRKLVADVDAAEGTFARQSNPRRAVALLSGAIAFQQSAIRPSMLPELHLTRGRAYIAAGDISRAKADFDDGLSELERQRTGIVDAVLRPGIFDDASELFDEAIMLQILRGSPQDVLAYIERGRARSLLEQINDRQDRFKEAQVPSIADIQRILRPRTALVEYKSLPDRLIIFFIGPERCVMRVTPVARHTLGNLAAKFTASRGAAGVELYEVLIAPIHQELDGVMALNVVSDDILQRVPFPALFERNTRTFLVERYAIATSPSAGVLLSTLKRLRHLGRRPPQSALIFANPTVPAQEFGLLPQLPSAENEALKVAHYYPHADIFVGPDASAERFRQVAPAYEVVHFAGHGVIRDREPFASALVCAATPGRRGGVTAHDIARMHFRSTHLVVLAACSTLTGRNAAIEGVPSLARAFVVAGVPAIVGTLWDIEDADAVVVTRQLHKGVAAGSGSAEALRSAQITAIRTGIPVSQWSAFGLVGSASSD